VHVWVYGLRGQEQPASAPPEVLRIARQSVTLFVRKLLTVEEKDDR
jgi:hypothetical protein